MSAAGELAALLAPHPRGCVLHVHVKPRAGREELAGRHGEALAVRVQAPPVEGRATEAARRVVAQAFGLPPASVLLVGGERSRLKRFLLVGVAEEEAGERLRSLLTS